MIPRCARIACLAVVLLACGLPVRAADDPGAPIPTAPELQVGKLANGLTYYIRRNATPARMLELRLVVKAGSILEDDDQLGLAHFVEHMAFGATTGFERHVLASSVRPVRVRFGADLNAWTDFDETIYTMWVPTGRKGNLAKAFTVLGQWAHGAPLGDADIDRERGIVLQELHLRTGVGERAGKLLYPKIFNGARYADRAPFGQEAVLRSFHPDALRRFYRDWYRPDLMAVVVVGDIDPRAAGRLIQTHFGALANPRRERPRDDVAIAPRTRTEAAVFVDKELPFDWLVIGYPVQPVPGWQTFGGYRAHLVETLFSDMLLQRLLELDASDKPFVRAGSGFEQLTARYRSYQLWAQLGQAGAAPAIATLVRASRRVREQGFGAAELEQASRHLLERLGGRYNERDQTGSTDYAAECIRNFLAGEPIPGIEAAYRLTPQLLATITLDEVNAFTRRALPAGAPLLVQYTGAAQPTAPDGARLLAALAAAQQAGSH